MCFPRAFLPPVHHWFHWFFLLLLLFSSFSSCSCSCSSCCSCEVGSDGRATTCQIIRVESEKFKKYSKFNYPGEPRSFEIVRAANGWLKNSRSTNRVRTCSGVAFGSLRKKGEEERNACVRLETGFSLRGPRSSYRKMKNFKISIGTSESVVTYRRKKSWIKKEKRRKQEKRACISKSLGIFFLGIIKEEGSICRESFEN